ncbi:DUF6427 family protein [Alkalitalea saponilacus]|uniref:Dolichyl-phosphate-mannose-protein mannosyltransferase n=1 Tax=Alkalitalea saponilacus TaxID=889453 RepID=A0A1T5HSV9_9BACT|nr:DUF6427 family protein [Alkalitalea saponilacus]ASB49219.1 hypothetical protein CDL62_08745 [Alkalitalea saponilacus]SKC23702.1 hypothetical protein SAMN03080601_02986 [Alkalitalea saponilacus]
MLLRTFHNNSIPAFVLIPLMILGFWMRFFFTDMVHITALDNPSMPLWDSIIYPYLGQSQFTSGLTTFLLALLIGWSLSRMVSQYGLLSKQSMLPLLLYGLFTSVFLSVQRLNPVWFFVLFLALGIERLFSGTGSRKPMAICFDAGFLAGIGSLFYAKGLFFFPILIITMGILRLASFRSIVAAILGVLFPFAISITWFFLHDKSIEFLLLLKENLITNPGQYNHNIFSQMYMSVIIIFLGLSIIATFSYMPMQKVIVRRYLRVFVWILLLTGATVLTPFFSMEMIPLAAAGSAVTMAFWLDKMRKNRMKEMIFLLLIVVTISAQLFL